MNRIISLSLLLLLFYCSCAKRPSGDVEIYTNDFESSNLSGITGGVISTFDNTKVLGNYNNGGFTVTIKDLPKHDAVSITFDLYIHDSWEGVQSGLNQQNGPDIWNMTIDDKTYINTTFANFDCLPGNFCPPQSFPADYPSQSNNPKSGASRTDLPGFCSEAGNPNGTTLYKIHKSISHSGNTISIKCLDHLIQKNVGDPKCDESWSIDNLVVRVASYN